MDIPPEASNSEVVENGALEKSDDAKEDVQKTEIVVLQEYVMAAGEPKVTSGQQEHCEAIFNHYI